jgi:exonuclease 3'-5' domain-containing protein 1
MNLEGKDLSDLSCPGNLSLITILVHPENKISIIDVRTMRYSTFMPLVPPAWGQVNKGYVGLKSIFEDPTIPKYLWGVRKRAHALKTLYNVGLAGVTDLQLLEYATRSDDRTHLRRLDDGVEYDAGLSYQDADRWAETKELD